jgi:glycosyltransferase involved in cell wall biosynthesis
MRVVEIIASGERGGGSEHVANLTRELSKLGVDLAAIVGADGPLGRRLVELGISVRSVDMMTARFDRRIIREVAQALRVLGGDLVHAHGTRGAFYATLARPGVPLVYSAHGLSYRGAGGPVGRAIRLGTEAIICRAAAEVIAVSRADLSDLRRRHLLSANKGIQIGNAVPLDRFTGGDRPAARRRLNLPDDAFVVGSVTRLVEGKAVADLIDSVLETPAAALVIVGDGPLRAELTARAQSAGDRIRFLGARDDVPEILPAFDVFALPSLWEGEPIVLLEAMAAGVPCISTRTSGAEEVLDRGRLGILTRVGDPASMAMALERLRLDPTERRRFATAARARVQERSWPSVAARVAGVYEAVLAATR